MANNNDHRSCMPENIVSYIYSEMKAAEVPAFEQHLAECSSCADEFAAISDARLSVFEWKRDAFDTLAVPQFEIPHEKVKAADGRAGWFETIFANIRLLAGAAGAFAVLAVVAGLGFYFLKPADSNLNAVVEPVAVPEQKIEVAEKQEPIPYQTKPEPTAPEKKDAVTVKRQYVPVPVVDRTRKPRISNSVVAEAAPKPKQTAAPGKMPTLNNFEDTEDDSLRLADLLADVGTKNDN